MKRLVLMTSLLPVIVLPGVANAKLSHSQAVAYGRAYAHVVHVFGIRTAGCKLIGPRSTCHGLATDGRILASTDTLHRMFVPVTVIRHTTVISAVADAGSTVSTSAPSSYSAPATNTAPANGLAQCIVNRESGGNSQAVNPNGHYGIAQWDVQTWQAQGGGRYSSTPLGASRSQQIAVLNQALANGQSSAWTPYDGC